MTQHYFYFINSSISLPFTFMVSINPRLIFSVSLSPSLTLHLFSLSLAHKNPAADSTHLWFCRTNRQANGKTFNEGDVEKGETGREEDRKAVGRGEHYEGWRTLRDSNEEMRAEEIKTRRARQKKK